MRLARDPVGAAEGRAILDQLPELYSAVIRSMQIEQHAGDGIRCSFELPVMGRRAATAATAREAIRAILVELADLLTERPIDDWPESWRMHSPDALVSASPERQKAERFQSKPRQFTVGVSMPETLKTTLQAMASEQKSSFAEVVRHLTGTGFEDFDERSFSEGPRELLSAFASELGRWLPSDNEQIMVRLEPHLAVRLRSAAKEYQRSASELGVLCLAHGFALQAQLSELEQKIAAVRGSAIRSLAPKVGLNGYAALLSGILAGSVRAPRKVLGRLAEAFGAPEPVLNSFFKHSFASRAVPAFKAENGKPMVSVAPTHWDEAVRSMNLPGEQADELLKLDEVT